MSLWPDDGRPLLRPAEKRFELYLYAALAAATCIVLLVTFLSYNVSAHGGVDQNGYLVGGKLLTESPIAGLRPTHPTTGEQDPMGFVGRMWIGVDLGTPDERYYPKYPIGYPALIAGALLLGGDGAGHAMAYAINPIAMALGVFAVFFLVRPIAGSALALVSMILVGTCPMVVPLSTNSNSHATSLFFVAWGLAALVYWSRKPTIWLGIVAGFLLGYSVTIRYTDGLFVIPMILMGLFAMRWRDWRSYLRSASLGVGWAIPVGILVMYNLVAIGSLTGYDPTNESAGFSFAYFIDNWENMLRQMTDKSVMLFFPLCLAGMVGLLWWHWRMGLFLAACVIPNVLTYTAYYWAPHWESLGFMRFFVSILPALAACGAALGAYLLTAFDQIHTHSQQGPSPEPSRGVSMSRHAWPVLGGSLVVLTIVVNLNTGLASLERDQINRLALYQQAQLIQAEAKPGSLIFSSDNQLLHQLQFTGDYELYWSGIFNSRSVRHLANNNVNADEPKPLQPQRQLYLHELLAEKSSAELGKLQRELAVAMLDAGRDVYVAGRDAMSRRGRAISMVSGFVFPRNEYRVSRQVTWRLSAAGRFEVDQPRQRTTRKGWGWRDLRSGRYQGGLLSLKKIPTEKPKEDLADHKRTPPAKRDQQT